MILHGYMDESGNSRFFTLSYLLARPKEWMWIESEWKKVLRQKNEELKKAGRQQISRFHAADCSSRLGEFKGWSVEEQIAFVKRLLVIFHKHMTSVVAYTVPINDFKAVFPEHKEDTLGALYRILTQFLMNQTVWDIQEQAGKQALSRVTIALIHDRSDYNQQILNGFDHAKNDSTFEGREIFVSITAQGWEDCVPLQAADLLAYETFKDAENQVIGRTRRKSLTSILEGSAFGGRSKSFRRDTLELFRQVLDADAAGLPRPSLEEFKKRLTP
jgi:hypothetical protein